MAQVKSDRSTGTLAREKPDAPAELNAATFQIAPMALADIPAVMDIERASFPLPWPEQAYRYELLQNTNAHFIVARALPAGQPASIHPAPLPRPRLRARSRGWLQRLLGFRPMSPGSPQGMSPDDASTIAGYAGMWMFVDEAHISTIASHPAWRGRGVGELLLLSLMREAERRAAIFVTLEVRVSNTVARNLYLKYGFEEVGLRKHYYRDNGEDALIMTVQQFQRPEYTQRLADLEQALRRRLAAA